MGAMRPLRRPGLWLGLWIAAIVAVIVVCLLPPAPLALPAGGDKVEHLVTYFLLSAGAVQLFATRRALAAAAIGLVLLGIGIEFAQGALTVTRMADPLDALANAAGVGLGMLVAATPARELLLRLERGR